MDKSIVGLQITLVGGRAFMVWDEEFQSTREDWMKTCERTGQFIYRVNGLRSWTHNGEAIAEDVLRTLIAGAVEVKALEPASEDDQTL